MRIRTVPTLTALLILAFTLAGCGLFEDYLPSVPPGDNVPAGDQASASDPTSSPLLPDLPGGSSAGPLKPVCFLNTGSAPATVMPWTFVPLNTTSAALPAVASTVSSPGGNSSNCLSLPLGTYTWCYHWELGDLNGDGKIDYAHKADPQYTLLDESDPDDLDLAERVTISPSAGVGELPGPCDLSSLVVMDIRPFIVESRHIDNYYLGYSMAVLAHLSDYVTLRGPITVDYYFHHCDASPCTTPVINEPTQRVSIPAGATQQFYLDEASGEHPGNWDLFILLISIDG